jgi:cysteine-rich repeat protein
MTMRLSTISHIVVMIVVVNILTRVTATGVCMDGVKDIDEQCDDGNNILLDGCSTTCELEDPFQSIWKCSTAEDVLSVCCAVLVNPLTLEKVCECATAEQPTVDMGFTITPQCTTRDIDECNTDKGHCHTKANCVNYDAAVDSIKTYECVCPPGWHGDGILTCDIQTYQTGFKLVDYDVESIDADALTTELQSGGVIPPDVNVGKIKATVASYFFSKRNDRRLLPTQTGVEITMTIISDSVDAMNSVTANINTTALPSEYTLSSAPVSSVLVSGRGLVNTMLGGFAVDDIVFSSKTNTWEIDSRYVTDIPNTITSPFISKVGASPYSTSVLETFEVSKFPCLEQPSVCCLNDYKDDYITGGFATDITNVIGTCGSEIQAIDTVGMFDASTTQVLVASLMDNYPNSAVVSDVSGAMHLSLAANDVTNSFSKRLDFADGHYELKFFVGMAYITLLPAPAISTSASQVIITVSVSPTLTFAFSSQQTYTFVQYLTMSVYQNKWIDANLVSHKMQFVNMGVVLPTGLTQNMQTGLVPLSSIRFAVAITMPDKTDTASWTNPCYSGDATGMYDDGNGNGMYDDELGDDIATTWESMYTSAAAQTCSFVQKMCINPSVPVIANRLAQFSFPIGDDQISTAIQNDGQYHLFVTFELSVIDTDGASIITDVFTEAPITRYTKDHAFFCFSLSDTVRYTFS